jgi:hypothetical protein
VLVLQLQHSDPASNPGVTQYGGPIQTTNRRNLRGIKCRTINSTTRLQVSVYVENIGTIEAN